MKRISVNFYRSNAGKEPVKEWLRDNTLLSRADRKAIGEDIKTAELGWPIGMPTVEKLDKDLWEMRTHISNKRIARVLFTVYNKHMILLHGFIKKSRKTPKEDMKLAKRRKGIVLK